MKKLAVGLPALWLLASPAHALEQDLGFSRFADSHSVGAGLDTGPPHGIGLSLELPYTTSQGPVTMPTVTLQYSS